MAFKKKCIKKKSKIRLEQILIIILKMKWINFNEKFLHMKNKLRIKLRKENKF
jgi:hypothetical protein